MIEILTDNHYEKMIDLFEGAKKTIKIISPFITESIADKLCEAIKKSNVKCTFITRIYIEDMLEHANNIDAIEKMKKCGIEIYALKGLHTKLYLFDDAKAEGVLGSANFTAGGFKSNIELSLLIVDEEKVLSDLHNYFDELHLKIKENPDGIVSDDLIDKIRDKYLRVLDERKEKGKGKKTCTAIFGAIIDKKFKFETTDDQLNEIEKSKEDEDLVYNMFKQVNSEQIKFDHTIWLKLHGESDDRMEPDKNFPMTDVMLNGKKIYLSNYPFNVKSINDNDEIYLASLTKDARGKNQPVIVGRGKLRGFSEKNVILDEWVKDYTWMDKYKYYAIIDYCEILNTSVKDGIPWDSVWEKFRSDTYVSSFGRNESLDNVAIKHHQKAHIRLSGNAKEFIDQLFESLKNKYGVVNYKSE